MLLFFDGFDFANLLVKTREGRPIKIDNNTITGARFSANARIHAYCRYMTTCV
jgi:molybdopterin-containing oxidoreductase family iron-sulfur binding subunit